MHQRVGGATLAKSSGVMVNGKKHHVVPEGEGENPPECWYKVHGQRFARSLHKCDVDVGQTVEDRPLLGNKMKPTSPNGLHDSRLQKLRWDTKEVRGDLTHLVESQFG